MARLLPRCLVRQNENNASAKSRRQRGGYGMELSQTIQPTGCIRRLERYAT